MQVNFRDFIALSIEEAVAGVIEARKRIQGTGAEINIKQRGEQRATDADGFPIHVLEFDLAVAVSREDGDTGKTELKVLSFGVGIDTGGEQRDSQTATNRVKFTVPIRWPKVVD